ncbi:hypothetical protein ACSBR1_013116 [Camellia fascicularis]
MSSHTLPPISLLWKALLNIRLLYRIWFILNSGSTTNGSKKDETNEAKKIIQSEDFWTKAAHVLKVQEPLQKVLRLVDGDEKPTMGFIYEAMDRAKLAIKKNCRYYVDYWKIIDNRWAFQLHTDLHAAAEWWIHYGTSALALQKVPVRVLSQTTSSSNCERNWSTFSLIHTKTRNRLKYKKLNKLFHVYYNMRLKIIHATRKSQDDREESFNPINLDYIFEEDDLLTPWLQEREHAILDDEDNSGCLIVDDDDEGDHATSSQAPQHYPRAGSARSGSSKGRCLSPLSGSGDDSDGSRPPTGGGSGGQWESAGSAHGSRCSIHHIDHDWNRDSIQQ